MGTKNSLDFHSTSLIPAFHTFFFQTWFLHHLPCPSLPFQSPQVPLNSRPYLIRQKENKAAEQKPTCTKFTCICKWRRAPAPNKDLPCSCTWVFCLFQRLHFCCYSSPPHCLQQYWVSLSSGPCPPAWKHAPKRLFKGLWTLRVSSYNPIFFSASLIPSSAQMASSQGVFCWTPSLSEAAHASHPQFLSL